MKKVFPLIILFSWVLGSFPLYAQESAEQLFKQTCAACHTINKGRLVGPDLANVDKRRSEDWIFKFVKSSQAMIKSGDPDAVAIFEEYNKVIMPDPPISESQIREILGYIKDSSPEYRPPPEGGQTETVVQDETEEEKLIGDARKGQEMFAGLQRFENGGPACNSCHHVKKDAILAGGALAKDLTAAYSRLSEQGVMAIVQNSPFPAMAQSYKNRPLTTQEAADITSFLEIVDSSQIYQHPKDYGSRFLFTGIIGGFILLGLYSMLWHRRKKKSENFSIYDRQIKSLN